MMLKSGAPKISALIKWKKCSEDMCFERLFCNNLCKTHNSRKFEATEERKVYSRQAHYRRRYGIEDGIKLYNELLKKQEGVCKICKQAETKNKIQKHLAFDHCHKTGKIRGLLCDPCNNLLGRADDSIEILEESIKYLKEAQKL